MNSNLKVLQQKLLEEQKRVDAKFLAALENNTPWINLDGILIELEQISGKLIEINRLIETHADAVTIGADAEVAEVKVDPYLITE